MLVADARSIQTLRRNFRFRSCNQSSPPSPGKKRKERAKRMWGLRRNFRFSDATGIGRLHSQPAGSELSSICQQELSNCWDGRPWRPELVASAVAGLKADLGVRRKLMSGRGDDDRGSMSSATPTKTRTPLVRRLEESPRWLRRTSTGRFRPQPPRTVGRRRTWRRRDRSWGSWYRKEGWANGRQVRGPHRRLNLPTRLWSAATRIRACAAISPRSAAVASTWTSVRRRRPDDSTTVAERGSRGRRRSTRRGRTGYGTGRSSTSICWRSAAAPDRTERARIEQAEPRAGRNEQTRKVGNESKKYVRSRPVSGGTGPGRTGPVRIGSGTGVKINSRERRAERTLIWVFLAFVVLWLPFFCANLTYGLCRSCEVPASVFAVFTWLGYLSSGVNPCIYTYLNSDFRKAFRNILACRRLGSRASRFPRQYSWISCLRCAYRLT